MKNKVLKYSLITAVLGIGFLGVNLASACGWFGGFSSLTPDQIATQQQTMFQNQAQILGISVDEVKNAWTQGKSFSQLATDKGITQEQLQTKLNDFRTQQLKTQLQSLVDKGVITKTQADQRLQFMQTKQTNSAGKMGQRMFRGFGF